MTISEYLKRARELLSEHHGTWALSKEFPDWKAWRSILNSGLPLEEWTPEMVAGLVAAVGDLERVEVTQARAYQDWLSDMREAYAFVMGADSELPALDYHLGWKSLLTPTEAADRAIIATQQAKETDSPVRKRQRQM